MNDSRKKVRSFLLSWAVFTEESGILERNKLVFSDELMTMRRKVISRIFEWRNIYIKQLELWFGVPLCSHQIHHARPPPCEDYFGLFPTFGCNFVTMVSKMLLIEHVWNIIDKKEISPFLCRFWPWPWEVEMRYLSDESRLVTMWRIEKSRTFCKEVCTLYLHELI